MLHQVHPVGKAPRNVQLHLILGLVRPVPTLALRLPAHGLGDGVFPGQLGNIVPDAVFIQKVLGVEPSGRYLAAQPERDPGIDHRLPLEDIGVVLPRDGDIGEYLKIGLPADAGAGLAASIGLGFQSANIFAFFKMEVVALAVPQHLHIHVFRGILGGAGAKTV